jgi:uncharacterized protein
MLTRRDWLLVFIGLPDGSYPTDQIRLMKGMFLLSKEGPPEGRDLYDFEPYDFGPFDKRVYADLDSLTSDGLIASDPVMGTNRRTFRVTSRGEAMVRELAAGFSPESLQYLADLKQFVGSMSFLRLLRHVYAKYPQYAVRSVMR